MTTTSVLIRSAVLLAVLLATFANAVPENDDLVFDPDNRGNVELPLIERHRRSSIFHRIKRGIWDLFGSGDEAPNTTEIPANQVSSDDQQQEAQEEQFLPPDWTDDLDEQQREDDDNYVNPTSSLERKVRESGEDPTGTEHPNAINGGFNDDEEYSAGSGDIEGSATGADRYNPPYHSNARKVTLDVSEPQSIPKTTSSIGSERVTPPPDSRTYIYRVTMIINEPYREVLRDRRSAEFKALSDELSGAIDRLYANNLASNYRTHSKILKFLPTSDPVATQASLDIESTNPTEERIRSILVDQLDLHTLDGIQVRPDGFSFRNMQDSYSRQCDPETELRCQSDGECIPIDARCDGAVQCVDESDEANCSPPETTQYPLVPDTQITAEREVQCRGDQTIRCRDGSRCFGSIQQCDGVQDCDDNSDEENCLPEGCGIGEFACDGSRCIPIDQKCNFEKDCDDNTDELDCPEPPACASDEFRCANGQCIPQDALCNGYEDCYDRSDEIKCQQLIDVDEQGYVWPVGELDNNFGNGVINAWNMANSTNDDSVPGWPFNFGYCPLGRWPCRTGKQCIPVWQRCDNEPHCDDMSDEDRCDERFCNPNTEWTCRNGRCIEKSMKCNGLDDCGDRSDEQTCPCTQAQFKCGNGFCIPKERRCDKYHDCQDKSDEMDCATPAPICTDQEFVCDDGKCIDSNLVCNNRPDCRDYSDERDCPPTEQVCTGDQFRCNDGTCLNGNARCNNLRECSNGEDEDQCGGCGIAEFRCMDGTCIPDNLLCDRSDDCPDGSDEGCDPCKLKSSQSIDLLRCRVRLNTPLCKTYDDLFPTLNSLNDLNTNCENVIRKKIIRNDTIRANKHDFFNTGRDRGNHDNKNNENSPNLKKDVEVFGPPRKSSDVGFVKPSKPGDKVRPVTQGSSLDKNWEYVQSGSKGRFEKRPKLRPVEQKLFDQEVKQCQINCLRLWVKQMHRGRFDNSLEMNVQIDTNRQTIDCLERAGNSVSEEDCFEVDTKLRLPLLSHLKRYQNANQLYSEKKRKNNKYEPKKRTARGAIANNYFKKYKTLDKFTPASTKATTTSAVISVTEKINTNSIWTHESVRERTPLESMYRNECKFKCDEYFIKLYDGKSNEISAERRSDERETTTAKDSTGITTTKEVMEKTDSSEPKKNWSSFLFGSNEVSVWDVGFESSPSRGGTNYEKNTIDETSETSDVNSQWEYVVKTPHLESRKDWKTKGTEDTKHKNSCHGEKGNKRRRCEKKQKALIEATTQSSTMEDRTDENDSDQESSSDKDDKGLKSTRNSDLRSTSEMLTTTETNEHQTVPEKETPWGFDLGSFWRTDGSKSVEEKSSRTSSRRPKTTTAKSWHFDPLSGGTDNSVESDNSRERNEKPNLGGLSDESNEHRTDISKSKSNRIGEKNRGKDGWAKTTTTETTTQISTTEEVDNNLCSGDEHQCDKDKCIAYELICDEKFDCEDQTDEVDCDYYFNVLKDFDYGPDFEGSGSKIDDEEPETNRNDDLQTTVDLRTTTKNYGRQTVTEKRNPWNIDRIVGGLKEEQRNSPVTQHSPATEKVTTWDKRLKQNYNGYNISFARHDSPKRGQGKIYSWRDHDKRLNEHAAGQRQQQLRKQEEETEQRRVRKGQKLKRYRDGLARHLSELERRKLAISKELERLDIEKSTYDSRSSWENGRIPESGEDISTRTSTSRPETTTKESSWDSDESLSGSNDRSKSVEDKSTKTSTYISKTTTEKWLFDWGGSPFGGNDDSKSGEDKSTKTSTYIPKTTMEKWSFDWGGSLFGGNDDSKSGEDKSTKTSTDIPKTTTEKWSFNWGGSLFGGNDDSKSGEDKSTKTSTYIPKTTTEKWSFDWGGSLFGGNDDSKSGKDKSTKTSIDIPKTTTEKSLLGWGGTLFGTENDSESAEDESSEKPSSKQPVTTDKNDQSSGSLWGDNDNSKNDVSSEERTRGIVVGAKEEERNNPVTEHSSATARVTTRNKYLEENYDAYDSSSTRNDNPPRWRDRGSYWRDNHKHLDSLELQRERQKELRRKKEEEDQRRMKDEQDVDRRREDLAVRRWELERQIVEIEHELKQLSFVESEEATLTHHRTNDIEEVNNWRRWPGRTDCVRGSRGCTGGRLTEGVADCPSMDFTCGDGSCVPQSSVCNGIDDCPLAEDELHCEKQCTVSEFRCRKDGKCINEAYRCDSTFDCSDHSDEEGCPPRGQSQNGTGPGHGRPQVFEPDHTTEGNSVGEEGTETTNFGVRECDPIKEFRCRNGQCIQLRRKCDIVPDCYDSSDESDCGRCNQDQWKCTSEECIPEIQRCDGITQCVDGSDEIDCVDDCPTGMFRCDDGLCLDGKKHCDGQPDCRDKSDEKNCSCPVDEWQCSNGVCIKNDFVCDRQVDCLDGSDEENCAETPRPQPACQRDEFQCSNGACVPRSAQCNGISDCSDGGDELGCPEGVEALDKTSSAERPPERTTFATVPVPSRSCAAGDFVCADGACIPAAHHCDHYYDCRDFTDEQYCFGCARDQFQCRNRNCIEKVRQCNGYNECGDNSDEENCGDTTSRCSPDEWRCENGPCIPAEQRCNGRRDCPRDESDELDCGPREVGCSSWEWRCENGQCIPSEDRCNGRRDCPLDNSDELDCPDYSNSSQQGLDLKVYPDDQTIKEKAASEGREVVIQCRDEGHIRARVHWMREDGAPLPLGSTDENGRLEMPNVQVGDSGNYICEALGVPPNTPGRRVVSHLTVEKEDVQTLRPPQICKFDEATCSNGDCIPKSKVCDGRYDCTDGTDEIRCAEHGCEPNQFRCANKECVSKVWRCDGDKDCNDGTDEENCTPPPPGSPCKYNEYQCARNDQCILKSFHCDRQTDCLDGSDEIGCTKVEILIPPPRMVILNIGETFTITCTALGIPIPEISWRLNWGHIPEKCTTTSLNGTGTLTCPNIAIEDQGAYSCEGINTIGWQFAVPDTILKVESPGPTVCPRGTFNSLARTVDECISCFCFGAATECSSADLFTYQLPAPFDQYNVVSVDTYPELRIRGETSSNAQEVRPVSRNGVQVTDRYADSGNPDSVLYFALPESYHGSQLKSYGGYLKYTVRYGGRGSPNSAPDVILSGNNYVLTHKGRDVSPDYETERSVRFFFGDWTRKQGRDEVTASREEIMMALANVDNILIKVKYDDGPIDTTISNVFMDTADVRNTDQGAATFVEECRCPVGYTGLSCEHCASGYLRRDSGPWLGQCYKDEPVCQPGYYQDPERRLPCQLCPCPLTNPSNQFARTCHLGADGQPTCDCPEGYLGRRCERCAPGYEGNPLIPGESCVKVDECDPYGSISPYANPATGTCQCKQLATGRTCNKCKANTFNLAESNKFGCVSCFCMGITRKCTSSNWYRSEIRVAFTSSIRDFSIVESKSTDPSPIVDGIHLNKIDREIVYNSFPNRENNEVYYWQLPRNFLGDQIASYGGNLQYTVRYVPSPGGGRSRNNAADVELISSNDINLLHYSGKQLEPNTAETFSVPLLEDYWQRSDGTKADREHLLMALADVLVIRIKATYTTHTDEAALSSVSLDTAVNSNTGKARAVEVEECSCPAGYRGLSCEDCDVGYTRGDDGLYLASCVPCSCNGHSTQCDSESGVCEYCRDHTTGDNCEVCEPGYSGDATRGTPQDCSPQNITLDTSCSCDSAGSLGNDCYRGQCRCKTNVEGPNCNQCRQSTFGLSTDNIDGCNECYCSGVTNQCHESSYYISQIPTVVYDSSHGFTLTDSNRRDPISEGFELNTATNEIGYRYPDSRSQRLFWSLPSHITGNQVKSYGGKLYITQQINTRPGAVSEKDQDVLLIGNGITLYWINPEEIQPGTPLSYSVPLVESSWTRLTQEEGPRSASRADLMSVLSNLEAILVRATYSSGMTATYISDVSLDTAVSQPANGRRATQVEACRCPPGYTGSSCELCATGHYRDVNDKSRSLLGSCNICPCSGNEQKCEAERSGGVKCHCLRGWTGWDCSQQDITGTTDGAITELPPPRIIVTIRETPIQIVEVGSTVTYHCAGRSEDSNTLRIEWRKESGQLPPGRSHDDAHGMLIIRDVKVSDSGVYVCQVSDGINIPAFQSLSLIVGTKPTAVIEPSYLTVVEGNPAEFRCVGSGNPQPQTTWVRVEGEMNPTAVFDNGIWRISAVRKSDEAEYKCIVENSAGTSEIKTILYVTGSTVPPPGPTPPTIDPLEWIGGPTDTIRLVCSAPRGARITWSRSENVPLPASAFERDGVLTIYNPTSADSGYYICTSITYQGVESSSTARVIIRDVSIGQPPIVRIEPDRQTVSQGTLAEVKCIATGEPTPTITWTKLGGPLDAHIQTVGNTLRIINPQVSDRGIYVCRATSSGGNSQGSAVIEVERRETPVIELYPEKNQVVPIGGSALLQCRAIEGVPVPSVSWARQDGKPFSTNVEQLPGGVLRFTQVTMEDGGSFVCSASNEVGSTSTIAVLEISSPPVITITPSNRSPLTVRLGERVRLTCSASGQPNPSVSWSKQRNIIPEIAYAGTPPSSTAVHEISSISYDDEGSYTCIATNAYGRVEERIQIRIEDSWPRPEPPAPNPPGPDDNLQIPDGGRVEMRCQVHSIDQEAIYLDWKRNDGRNLPQESTVRDGILLIPRVTKNDAGHYICQGLDDGGNVLFTASTYLEIISPPRIELVPVKQFVKPGESPSVICRVTGDQPIDIQWDAIDRPLPYTVTQSRGVLQFNGITISDAGKYVCKATNSAGTAEAVAEVFVNVSEQPPSVPENQRNINTYVGNSVKLECAADSRSVVDWSRERGDIPRNSYRLGNILELTEVKAEDSGRYVCRITNENGISSSNYIDLRVSFYGVLCSPTEFQCNSRECIDQIYLCDGTVDCADESDEQFCLYNDNRQYPQQESAPTAPVNIRIRASQDLVNIGDTIDIQCDASGARDVRFRWIKLNEPSLPSNAQDYGADLRLSNVAMSNTGVYRCIADTADGTFDKDYELVVQGGHNDAPAVETKLAPYGSRVEMDCRVEINPPITFQWHKLGGRLPASSRTFDNQLQLLEVKAEDAGTYICTANNGQVNIEVPQVLVVTGVVPNFNQAPQSYISLPPLPDASLQFNIEVSFKPESYAGVILYNGQYSNGSGDFLLLSLVGGYPEFRFDLGSSPAIIRGQRPVTLGKWHTIKLQRDHREGTMLVDGEGPYRGSAGGRFQTLDLSEPLYVGGVPDYSSINRQANVNSGFVGCISKLVIGENQFDLASDPLSTVGVTTCETCAENPCSNNGVCQEAATDNGYTCLCPAGYSGKLCANVGQACYQDACGSGTCIDKEDGFVCSCPLGKVGSRCELDINIDEPAFHDRGAYMAYQTPKALRKIKLAMKLKPSDGGNGILMYCSQSNDGLGDFIALVIKDRHVEFRFDSGSGMAVVRSNHVIQPGMWLHVEASRDTREGKLSVNDELQVIGRSPGPVKSMTLNTLLYIGGVNRQKITVNKNIGVEKNFRGCISKLDIAGQRIDILRSVVDSSNIKDCIVKSFNQTELGIHGSTPAPTRPPTTTTTTQFNPCSSNPCIHGFCEVERGSYACLCEYGYVGRHCENVLKQCELLSPCRNGGTCIDLHGGYKCDCQLGFTGDRCETSVEISSDVAFRGDGWLELDRSIMTHEEGNELLGFEISTNKSSGLIMWHGQTPADSSNDDYISLAVVDGYIEYRYNLGSGAAVIRVTARRIDDGERHRIVLKRQGSDGSIELNGEHMESGASGGLQQILNARGSVYLGGVPDYAMTNGTYQDGFSGCIYTLEVQDSGAIIIGDKAIRGKNVYPCTSGIDTPPIRGDGGDARR